jgi:hypothetical protein
MSSAEDAGHPPDHPNPWKSVSTRIHYENPWIRVREDQVVRPDGLPGIYGVVEFKNRAVGVLPVEDDGSVWLVGQYRYPLNAYSWEIPEGGCPESETPETTARRELREETGLTAGRVELASVELGQRRARLSFPGNNPHSRQRRSRGNRTAGRPAIRVERGVADAQKRRDYRLAQCNGTLVRGHSKARAVRSV